MRQIAVILSGDGPTAERALEVGKQFAEGFSSDLTVFRTYDENIYSGSLQRKAISGLEIATLDELEEQLSDSTTEIVKKTLAETPIQWKVNVLIGNIPTDIVNMIEGGDSDHIVVPAEQNSPTGKVIFGDTAQSLILNTPVPTTVVTES